MISPDGKKVAFAAVGDIYVMNIGGKPENITKDKYLDTDPPGRPTAASWSIRPTKAADSPVVDPRYEDRPGPPAHSHDNPAAGRSWSPDGKRIAFFDVDAMWRAASISVVDVASGKVTKIHNSLFGPGCRPGRPTASASQSPWFRPIRRAFAKGTNQILTMSSENGSGPIRRRQMVRARAQSLHRFPRFLRPGLVARWQEDGGHL